MSIREYIRVWKLKRDPRWANFVRWTNLYNPPGVTISFGYWLDVLDEGRNEMAMRWEQRASNRVKEMTNDHR